MLCGHSRVMAYEIPSFTGATTAPTLRRSAAAYGGTGIATRTRAALASWPLQVVPNIKEADAYVEAYTYILLYVYMRCNALAAAGVDFADKYTL